MTDNGGKQTGNNPPLEGKKRSNIDKGAVFNCKWCKSVNFATAKDFIHIFVFCMDCGKVSVYVKRRTFSGVKNNPAPEGKERIIRSEIMQFAVAMEAVMSMHDSRKGNSWRITPLEYLINKLKEEFVEWETTPTKKELIDVANVCMMLFHRKGIDAA